MPFPHSYQETKHFTTREPFLYRKQCPPPTSPSLKMQHPGDGGHMRSETPTVDTLVPMVPNMATSWHYLGNFQNTDARLQPQRFSFHDSGAKAGLSDGADFNSPRALST